MIKKKRLLSRLPSLPTIAVEILRVFGDPDAPMQQIANLVQADPALASKILKAANSTRFGLPREVSNLQQAMALMGKAKITPLVLSFSLASESVEDTEQAELFKSYWLRSFVQATAGEVLGSMRGGAFGPECFTLNLLAGIGQLGLLKQETETYLDCLEKARSGEQSLEDAERAAFETTHLELSVDMLEESGLPQRFVDAIRAIAPGGSVADLDSEAAALAEVASVADAFARYLCDEDRGVALVVLQERLGADGINMSLEDLTAQVREKLDESASLFNIDPSVIPEPEDLLEDALEQLSEFTEMINDSAATGVPAELMAENGRLKEQVESLVIQTSTDALTGVANRAYFDRRLDELNQHCLRHGLHYGIAAVDIDHFKSVNDTHGHQAGDAVLQKVAQALQSATRSNETLARYGGEEFAVLMEDISEEGLDIFGERLRAAVESLRVEFQGTVIPVTISVGLAGALPTHDDYHTTLFGMADANLYQAKQTGRNRVVSEYHEAEVEAAPVVDAVS